MWLFGAKRLWDLADGTENGQDGNPNKYAIMLHNNTEI